MARYRHALPQLNGDIFLTDAGLETDLIFNHGIDIREFAVHTLLPESSGRAALAKYLRGYLDLAKSQGTGLVLDSQTWKAHMHWTDDLGATEAEIRTANQDAIKFIAQLREEFAGNTSAVVLNGVVGPCGDAYAPEAAVAIDQAEAYHAKQLAWLAETDADMVTALTFTQSDEAARFARSARTVGLPSVISFTVETDGSLPTGQPLNEAIEAVDAASDNAPAYYMVNCAHPDHFAHVLGNEAWAQRIRGLRCNASRQSHAELDACEVLDDGNPHELVQQYRDMRQKMPWLNVFGGCCGSDIRHVTEIAYAIAA